MARLPFVAAAIGLALSGPAMAQGEGVGVGTGNQVYALCTSSDSGYRVACSAWVAGFADGIVASNASGGGHAICLPPDSNAGQYQDVVVAYLRDNPAIRHRRAGALAYEGLMRAFPCRRSR